MTVGKRAVGVNNGSGIKNKISSNTLSYKGIHLIIDFWHASHLDDLGGIEKVMRACTRVAGASLLDIHLHHFTPNDGVTGVALLAESHISIHTWPENSYAAVDIFMCGETRPDECIDLLCDYFETHTYQLKRHLRGDV